jgi:tetratricopeptide (TPR) repeat protein
MSTMPDTAADTARGGDGTGLRRRPRPAVGPRLRRLLQVLMVLFALLVANSVYLGGISVLEWATDRPLQGALFQYMFLAHLLLGVLIVGPFVVYALVHARNAHDRPNRRAVYMGYVLLAAGCALLLSGFVLTRGLPGISLPDVRLRQATYWLHVVCPLLVGGAFVLHRLAGPAIRWRRGVVVVASAAAVTVVAGVWQGVSLGVAFPSARPVATDDAPGGMLYPSLAKTADRSLLPAKSLANDAYCADCHEDVHGRWRVSAHRVASFNNPAYRFSVLETRRKLLARDGHAQGTRFCAGCHDPVPLFSGEIDQEDFDPDGPSAQAGITCTVCHAITSIDSPRGNADYTLSPPVHYPFADAAAGPGKWLNHLLIRANPDFHRRTFLKPLHESAEFCGTCHKVHLPEALNAYRWLRGQNHYDAWLLSGVSGHGASSFYYPAAPRSNCNGCHMPLQPSTDFGARVREAGGEATVHDHLFPSANTALGHWLGFGEQVRASHREMLEGALRVDIFGVRPGGDLTKPLVAPLRPQVPRLRAGEAYLFEVVLRTLTLGHAFTQGTADSNEVWLEVTARLDGEPVGVSGQRDVATGAVDRDAHFVNAWVLDRDGRRIDRRNAEDIFTVLYNHQIPPGAADVVHYHLELPPDAAGELRLEVALNYRKFDTDYVALIEDASFDGNDLPVTVIARDAVTFEVDAGSSVVDADHDVAAPDIPAWERWNDYGIGLLRKPGAGELRQAEEAFQKVQGLGRGDGSLNLARVYLREGRIDDAADALGRAAESADVMPWVLAWLGAQVDRENGYLEEAMASFEAIAQTRFPEAQRRGFDFSRDYRVLNELGVTSYQRARLARGEARRDEREQWLSRARAWYERVLVLDPENVTAHYGLAQVFTSLGDAERAAYHRDRHGRYKVDDNAADRAVAAARRRDAVADRAAEATVIYDLRAPAGAGRARTPDSSGAGETSGR